MNNINNMNNNMTNTNMTTITQYHNYWYVVRHDDKQDVWYIVSRGYDTSLEAHRAQLIYLSR